MKKQRLYYTAAAGLFLLFIIGSQPAREGAANGLRLMGDLLIPSLLPFFTAAGLLNRLGFSRTLGQWLSPRLGKLFGIGSCGCTVFLLGLSGGYPLGAAAIADLYRTHQLDTKEARHLLRFCDNTGPSFALGAVGSAFGSPRAGLYLWAVHLLGAVILGLALRRHRPAEHRQPAPPNTTEADFASAFTTSLAGAVEALMNIGGFVIFFGAFLAVLNAASLPARIAAFLSRITPLDPGWWQILLAGMLELSTAVGRMQGLSCTGINLAAAAFILSWGGLCIHFQSLAVLRGTGLNGKERLKGKLLHGVLSAVLAYLLHSLFF